MEQQQQQQQQSKAEDRKRVFAEIERQEAEQKMFAPGFLEWRKVEDARLLLLQQSSVPVKAGSGCAIKKKSVDVVQ